MQHCSINYGENVSADRTKTRTTASLDAQLYKRLILNSQLMISMRGQRQRAKFKGIITITRVEGHF